MRIESMLFTDVTVYSAFTAAAERVTSGRLVASDDRGVEVEDPTNASRSTFVPWSAVHSIEGIAT